MALHLVSLPWTETTKRWEPEAFTARTRVLATMMAQYGAVYLYAGEENEARITEHVPIVNRRWQARHFPGFTPNDVFTDYDPMNASWIEFAVHAADAIRERSTPGDILGITMGSAQQLIVNLTKDLGLRVVEVGVGYKGIIDAHRVYESRAWQMFHAGLVTGQSGNDIDGDVRNFDTVIPRGYEIEDFPAGAGRGGYFLFLGRVVARKGPQVAAQVCQRIGAKLIVAGQKVASAEPGRITADDGGWIEGDVEYAGVIGPEERAKLLGGAIAIFVPTLYFEPFGGVHAEALLCGTPVISTPWGAFEEYIDDGVNGYKCSTLAEFVDATRKVEGLDRAAIRAAAIARYGTATVGRQYNDYFNRLATLRREGWYELPPQRIAA